MKKFLLTICFLFFSFILFASGAEAADRYWVGGTASWDGTAGTKWATTSGGAGGAAVPTTADDVFFDANSSPSTPPVVTVATGHTNAKSLNFTGFTGTLAGSDNLSVAGSITFSAGMTLTYSGNLTMSGTGTLTMAGQNPTFNFLVNGSGITCTLGDSFNLRSGSRGAVTLTMGTLSLNNLNHTFYSFTSSNSNVRTLNMGSGTLDIKSNSTTNFAATTATNFTLNYDTSTLHFSGTGSAGIYVVGGKELYNVIVDNTINYFAIPSAITIRGDLTITGISSAQAHMQLGGDLTVNGNLSVTGASNIYLYTIFSTVFGTARTLSVGGTKSFNYVVFGDITASGGTPWTGTRLGNIGNVNNITTDTPRTLYWVHGANASYNISDSRWSLSSGGTVDQAPPLPQDTLKFDANSFPSSGKSVIFNLRWPGTNVDFTGMTNNPNLAFSSGTNNNFLGSFTMAPTSGSITYSNGSSFYSRGAATITSAGEIIPFNGFYGAGRTVTTFAFADNFDSTGNGNGTTISACTIDIGDKTMKITKGSSSSSATEGFTFNGGTVEITTASASNAWITTSAVYSGAGTVKFSGTKTGTVQMYGINWSTGTLEYAMSGTDPKTYYWHLSGANTIGTIKITTPRGYLAFQGGQTTTVGAFDINGTAGNLKKLGINTGTTKAIISCANPVDVDYVDLSYLDASGSVPFYAGANSTDSGNNLDWNFTARVSTQILRVGNHAPSAISKIIGVVVNSVLKISGVSNQ